MVEAGQVYHPKVFRAIHCLAKYYAREEVKQQIRGRGQKVSHYTLREISIMAHLLLEATPQEFVDRAKASAVVKEIAAEIAAKERRKLERKLQHSRKSERSTNQALPLNETHAQNGDPR